MRRDVGFAVAHEPVRNLPVCYALPGRDGTALDLLNDLLPFAAAAFLSGKAAPFATVAVDGGNTYWHRRKSGEDRLAMLLDEFVPWFGAKHGCGPAAIFGVSMGGYGALLSAQERPQLFSAVAVTSPAIWTGRAAQESAVPDAFDSAEDFAEHDVVRRARLLGGIPLRIACGRSDPFLPGARALAARLPPRQVMLSVADGCHDDGFFRSAMTSQVAFIGRHLAACARRA